jgi:uncharacterized membrane protein
MNRANILIILIDWNKHHQFTPFLSASFLSRLGGFAGLLGIGLALVQVLRLVIPVPGIEKILQILPNLAAIVWLIGIYAFQSSRLGRLGSLGLGAATVGLSAIIGFNFLQEATGANSWVWVSSLLANPAMPLIYTVTAVLFVWGILALGTSSLQAGMLPRGAVVLWMIGSIASLTTSWLPVSLLTVAGISWTSIILLRGVPVKDASRPPEKTPAVHAAETVMTDSGRRIPLDALRGVIIILMAIDHASYFIRRWHPFETWDQPLPDYPSLAAMLTRLATHPCAPGFFFLMGAGMVLFSSSRRQLGWSERKIAGHLALRGLLFIALEQLIVDLASAGHPSPFEFSILAGLGAVILFGILFLRLNGPVQAAAGVAILLLMQFLPGLLLHADLGTFNLFRLLILPGSVGIAFVLYPPIPWLGVALLGMAFACLLQRYQDKAYQVAGVVGLACLALFPLVRALGGLGNLRMPSGDTLIDFFNVVKYPPSLSFLLLSLGFDLVMLYLISRTSSKFIRWIWPVVILGQAALYFFLAHWFVYASMGLVWNTPGNLPKTYLAWAVGLLLLYPVCKTYEAFKHRMPANTVWRML